MTATFKIARVGDICTHGAVVITGDPTRIVDGRKVARRGDFVSCPLHGLQPIVTVTASIVKTSDRDTARVGSMAACGAVILTGSEQTKIDK